jgi:hypothetical protein
MQVALCAATPRLRPHPCRAPQRPCQSTAQGRTPSQAAQLPRLPAPHNTQESIPRHAPACHPRHAGRTRTARPTSPSTASHPRAPYYSRNVTLPSPQVERAAYKRRRASPRRWPPLPPSRRSRPSTSAPSHPTTFPHP